MSKGFTIWLMGLSGAGKSTLAIEIEKYLMQSGHQVQVLDGDIVRSEVGHLFGYSKEERLKASKVIRFAAKLLNKNGIITIVAAITPYQETREVNRKELDYIEIFVNCPIEECIHRDTKGLYEKALKGEMKHVVGIDEIYELPKNPDIEINTMNDSIEESMEKIKAFLESRIKQSIM